MTGLDDKIQRAGEHFRAGQISVATGLCLEILRTEPEHAAAQGEIP